MAPFFLRVIPQWTNKSKQGLLIAGLSINTSELKAESEFRLLVPA
jgi:hypothetical protein